MSNYEELIRPEFEVQCKKLGRGIERGVHSGEYASLPTYDAWEALKSATSPLLAALEEKDQRIKGLEDSAALDQHRIRTLEALADQNDKQRDHWMERAKAAEQRLQQPEQGEVLVTVSGFTGCGKSAVAGEIEIALRAIGLPVTWTNGDAEKRMTGADYLTALEMYKPRVRIVEQNVVRFAGFKVEGE